MTTERKIFIARAIAWALFACVLPVLFIGWRYDLFRVVSNVQFGGWGLIAVVMIFAFLTVFARYLKSGFPEWSMTKQIVSGVAKILIPLGALLAICVSIRSSLDYFIQALSCTLMCEAIAIPLNPFPKWVWDKSQGRFESSLDYLAERIGKGKDKKEGK